MLELSLEYLENPYVESAEEVRQVLSRDILIEGTGKPLALSDLNAQTTWSERDDFDQSSPAPLAKEEDDAEHKLIVANVDLSGFDAESLSIRIKEDSQQAVVFWEQLGTDPQPASKPDAPLEPVRWQIYIANDSSFKVEVPPKPNPPPTPEADTETKGLPPGWEIWLAIAVAGFALAVLLKFLAKRKS